MLSVKGLLSYCMSRPRPATQANYRATVLTRRSPRHLPTTDMSETINGNPLRRGVNKPEPMRLRPNRCARLQVRLKMTLKLREC